MPEQHEVKLSTEQQETLRHLTDLLHLFHHRNKNQHRRSIWWRHFSIFRKQLSALLQEVAALNETPKTHLERSRKKAKDKERRLHIAQRLDFWRDVLVPKWHAAFSQIVADSRFAVLGLVLMAALAQVCQIAGIAAEYDELGQAEVERVLVEFGREFGGYEGVRISLDSKQPASTEDIGEVVQRDALPDVAMQNKRNDQPADITDKGDTTVKRKASAPLRTSQRKKRKKGDAIDDLFSGLD